MYLDRRLPPHRLRVQAHQLEDLCRHVGLHRLEVVALSGYGGEEYRSRGHGAGFDAYLVKPIELDSLLAVLDSVRKSTRQH